MVSIGVKLSRLQINSKLIDTFKFKNNGAFRPYSVYPPKYIFPTFRKEDQAVMELTGEAEELAHTLVRPPLCFETCSEFYSPVVSKLINYIMRKGQKQLARSLVEGAFEEIKRRQLEKYHEASPEERSQIELDPIKILEKAVENTTPVMQLRPIKKGGATYQVPVPLKEERARFMAMNWIRTMAKEKDANIRYTAVLAKELIDAANNKGRVVKKKQDLHKQCEANRAFAHFRWL